MFKDGECFSKFNNKKNEQCAKSSITAMIFDKSYQRVRLKLMKSFDTTKKFAAGYMFLEALYLPQKIGQNGLFEAFLEIFRLNGEVLSANCLSLD